MIFLKQKSGQQKKTRYPFLKRYLRQAVMQMMKLPGKKERGSSPLFPGSVKPGTINFERKL